MYWSYSNAIKHGIYVSI